MKRLFNTLLLGIAFLMLFTSPALAAIGDPAYVTIEDAYVFRDLMEDGDWLFFVRYDVSYNETLVEGENAEDYWQMALYDTDGTTLIATMPLNYFFHNIISMYLTAAQASALTWEDPYVVKIMGMPSIFDPLVEDVNMQTRALAPGDYYEVTSLGDIMIAQAGILEVDWGEDWTLLTTGEKLNTTGSFYFRKAIPNLNDVVPEIFETTLRGATVEYTPWSMPYSDILQTHEGERLRGAVTNIGTIFGISEGWSGFWLMGMIFLLVAGGVYGSTRNPGWGMVAAFPVLVGAAWLGIGTQMLELVIIVSIGVALIFAIYFILARFA